MQAHLLESPPAQAEAAEAQAEKSSLQTTVDRGTQTLKSVLAQAGSDRLKALQVTINEVEYLITAAHVAAGIMAQLDPTEQKFNEARLRGIKRMVELRKAAEPVLETGEVCELLGVSRETIRKKVDRRRILALPKGDDRVFPAFQFKDGAVLNGIPEVLQALETKSVFAILAFLLSTNPDFDKRTAIQLLEAGEVEPVLSEARTFLNHGG